MTLSRCVVRLLVHFVKGMAFGSGMYAMDYLLVNGHFIRLCEKIASVFNAGEDEDIRLIP